MIVAGVLTPLQAWVGWARAERALRLTAPLPSAGLALPLIAVIVAAGVVVLLAVVLA